MAKSKKTPDFETALTELETLVQAMEGGEMSLEESLAAFERGIRLTRECQAALDAAEQKVELLLNERGDTQPFDPAGAEADAE